MSKRHFEGIARVIGSVSDKSQRACLVVDLGAFFAEENPRFDRDRFSDAVDKRAVTLYGPQNAVHAHNRD